MSSRRSLPRFAALALAVSGAVPVIGLADPADAKPKPRLFELSLTDNGRTIEARPGDYIFVGLTAPAGDHWTAPKSKSERIVETQFSATITAGDGIAVFKVARDGNTKIVSRLRCRDKGAADAALGTYPPISDEPDDEAAERDASGQPCPRFRVKVKARA